MAHKPIAIILGGTSPHIALIDNLKNRGYFTLLIDYYQNPPAKKCADEHIQESTLDKDKVLEIARKRKADLVISTCIDQANVTACYVAEILGLPAPYSYETALNVSNKVLMKRKMEENGIPTAKFIVLNSNDYVAEIELPFPVVVKPSDCTGSKGVRMAETIEEAKKYIKYAQIIGRKAPIIIEEYYEGKEIQVDCFILYNEAHVIMVRKKQKLNISEESVMQSHGSIVPVGLSNKLSNKIEKLANNIAKSFELNNTSLMIQMMVYEDDIKVIEFAPRVGGGLSYSIIKIITGFDMLDATIDSFLGISPEVIIKPNQFHYSSELVYAKQGIYGSVSGYQNLLDKGIIEEFYQFKTKGMKIGPDMTSADRVCAFLIKANDFNELIAKTTTAINKLEVYDINGKQIMRKDIYNRDM